VRDLETTDLIVTRELAVDAIPFNCTDWTPVAYLSGHTNWTGHTKTIIPEAPIVQAGCYFGLQGLGSSVRARGYQYDANGQKVWWDLGSVTHNGPNNVQQLWQDMKAGLLAAFAARPYLYVTTEVKGVGYLYLARMEVTWNKPDVVDPSATIAALADRVAALEGMVGTGTATGASNGVDSEARSRIATVESKLTAVADALKIV
jgi:hypothetical protein